MNLSRDLSMPYLPLALCLLLLTLLPGRALAQAELTVLNWPDYLDAELVEAFEREHGVGLNLIYFETDDDRDALLVETQGRGYDVVLVNGSNLASYVRRGWLEPLDPVALTQLEHLDPRWRAAYEAAQSHGVLYLWGTLGEGRQLEGERTGIGRDLATDSGRARRGAGFGGARRNRLIWTLEKRKRRICLPTLSRSFKRPSHAAAGPHHPADDSQVFAWGVQRQLEGLVGWVVAGHLHLAAR